MSYSVRLAAAVTASVLVVSALIVLPATAASAALAYRAVDLGTLGGAASAATATNDRGTVVGWSMTADGARHAFLWRHGTMTDLGVLPGHVESTAVDVNERGEVVGTSTGPELVTRAVLWRNGQMIDLGTLGGDYSEAVAVNDRGQVLGLSNPANHIPHRVVWQDGAIIDLGRQDFYELTTGFNNRGDVVGTFNVPPYDYPCTCVGGRLRDGVLTPVGDQATAINNLGDVVGIDDGRAFRWRAGALTDLGTLGGATSRATAVNDLGVVLGSADTAAGVRRPVLWWAGRTADLTAHGLSATDVVNDLDTRNRLVGSRAGRATLFR
ncbi:HAF repeat-containing protein [Micromonospora sp. HNM0581]|uniref:HAF repeat-containing protein n=1 Tax=Micromonospora sp. HNM0581 TaxID=2716341 RepID=UPI00146C3C97|nr:HAF repeat-containing protein [Micromonospora sp. HNM0581]NLU79666.1 HAF repeat-containing protein [Micromonospora sp. HNM0581]